MIRALRSPKLALCLLAVVLFTAKPAPACGPFALGAVFTFVKHPEFPLEKFAAGQIGVVQPTYARSYLVGAYRHLNGPALTASEQKQIQELWQQRLEFSWPDSDEEWPKPWLKVRETVPGVAPLGGISTSRRRDKPNEYDSYINCQSDAFEIAATTLTARIKKFGLESAVIKDWVMAQDFVFSNCSQGSYIPDPAPADSDPLIKADRTYQIAAAKFYSSDFDEAFKSFEGISHDSGSPWRQTATYLTARTMLRKASLGPAESKTDSLTQAQSILEKILKDQSLAAIHPASDRLMSLVRLRLNPEGRARELAQRLEKKNDDNFKQDLWDYTILLDDLLPSDDSETKQAVPEDLLKDDLTDWIAAFETGGDASLNHALDRWHASSSMPWLVAVMTKMTNSNPQLSSVLTAADKVPATSAAFPSVSYHRVRLLMESGRLDQARARVDDVLTNHRSRLPASTLNVFLALRMKMATTLADALKYAMRVPAGFSWDEDGRELPADMSDESEMGKDAAGQPRFDVDGAKLLNQKLPLTLLTQAAESKILPAPLQREVVQATWLRAILLDDHNKARAVSATLKTLAPESASDIDKYLSTASPDEAKFAGIFAWLRAPGMQPIVTSGVGRRSALNEQDSYRDNWWCAATTSSTEGSSEEQKTAAPPVTASDDVPSPLFLTAVQKTAAKQEYARLSDLGAAPNYLCKQVIAWVQSHPADPRGPEALHLAVKSTRYGCTDKETGKWSKAAHDLLHKRFPNNSWTKKTPYWFKD